MRGVGTLYIGGALNAMSSTNARCEGVVISNSTNSSATMCQVKPLKLENGLRDVPNCEIYLGSWLEVA